MEANEPQGMANLDDRDIVLCRGPLAVSNRLDPGQARHFVGPDLDPNCL